MVHITGNFLAESPLSPMVKEAIASAMDQGWSEARKIAHSASRARILQDEALALISGHLNLRPDQIEILGEPSLGHFFAVQGLLRDGMTLVHSAVDRKEIFALARGRAQSLMLPVDIQGRIDASGLEKNRSEGVFALQGCNGETGVLQDLEGLSGNAGAMSVCLDLSANPDMTLPSRWDTALYDARSWGGPQAIAVLAIKDASNFKNPLPHLGSTRTPQSFSLPLLIGAAIALDQWRAHQHQRAENLRALNEFLRSEISKSIDDVDIAGKLDISAPHIASFSFLYVEGEELLRKLEQLGYSVDSGSACTAEDLQPSHVLAAMGLLTHGNIRITLHHCVSRQEVVGLVEAIKSAVTELRSA